MRFTAGLVILSIIIGALFFEMASAGASFGRSAHAGQPDFCRGYAICR